MENNEVLDVSVIVTELQNIQTQNEALLAEVQSAKEECSALRTDVTLLVLLVFVLVVYKIRDLFLMFVKRGIRSDV